MSNLSYCMFQNTLSDLVDCAEKLEDLNFKLDPLSKEERQAAEEIISLCHEIVQFTEEE